MNIKDISVPEVYKKSADFRFFLKWFNYALTKVQYDITNTADLYDPLRCPENLLWMLGDTMGYQFDDRLCTAFNRFAMLYFMSMIRYKGSKLGVTLAAEVNLKQKDINAYGQENEILYNRLEDAVIPNNSVYVEPNVEQGYINIVYFTDAKPIDSCIEYVRPLGMYCFQYAGVRIDSATKISIDARLARANDSAGMIGPTKVGHYSRNDFARLQKMVSEHSPAMLNNEDTRNKMYSRNPEFESEPIVDAGYRALNSLQMANNEHIVKSLFSTPNIFDIGYGPTVDTMEDVNVKNPKYNLRYNKTVDEATNQPAVYTLDPDRTSTPTEPKPKVDNIMLKMEDRLDT